MLNQNKCTKTKPKPEPTLHFKNCSYVCVSLCTTVVHNTAHNSCSCQTIVIAQTMSTGGQGSNIRLSCDPTRRTKRTRHLGLNTKLWTTAAGLLQTGHPSSSSNNGVKALTPTRNKSSAVADMGPCLATTNTGRKVGAAVSLSMGEAGSPSNTMLPGPRPTSVPSDILIHTAVWPQQIWAKKWGGGRCAPFGGSWVLI